MQLKILAERNEPSISRKGGNAQQVCVSTKGTNIFSSLILVLTDEPEMRLLKLQNQPLQYNPIMHYLAF